MLGRKKKPVPDGKIEKTEDKVWKEWFDKLSTNEHEKYLRQLGLGKEEIQEWEQANTQSKKPQRTDK